MTLIKPRFAVLGFCFMLGLGMGVAQAADLKEMAASPSAGITFEDKPLSLPVQRNFQMAMLTASSELGRSCGHMESYGWRMDTDEQPRVNTIFNSTVDSLRGQGFSVESKAPSMVSRDVTVFTADRADKHLLFLWSAGEIGLVMVLCETSAPLRAQAGPAATSPDEAGPSWGGPVRAMAEQGRPARASHFGDFTPVGDWVGTYTCSQGTTGGTLHIGSMKGGRFDGTFRFYPTPKNPYVPAGRYRVSGEYDRDSFRILINPGAWLERPKGYFSTIMIGTFEPESRRFSGMFQGIDGCTSFEAHYGSDKAASKGLTPRKAKKKARKAAVSPAPAPESLSAAPASPAAAPAEGASSGIKVDEPAPAAPPELTAPAPAQGTP